MKSKKLVISYFLSLTIVASSFFGTIWYYDPLKIFHNPYKYKKYLQPNMRQQAVGIINNWDFDSVVLGTSMLENTSSKDANKILGGKFVNISLSAGDFWERKLVMNYLFKKKPIKKVLYSLDDSYGLVTSRKGTKDYPLSSFNYLYDSNFFNDFKVYMNDKYLKCIFSFKSKSACIGRMTDSDRPNAWYKKKVLAIRFGGLENWLKEKNQKQMKRILPNIINIANKIQKGEIIRDSKLEDKILSSKKYLDETIINLAKQYPKTEFVLVIPPYSRLQNAIDAQYNKPKFKRIKASIKYLVDASSRIKNMKIYGWGNTSYPDDIAHYQDLTHYHYTFNAQMLQYIQKNIGLLTNKNIDNYLFEFEKNL